MYFLMSLFAFSIAPFCHEQYESAKYTFPRTFPPLLSILVISRCAANSQPLSVVIVWTNSLYGKSSLATTLAVGSAFRPHSSFSIIMKLVERSVSVTMACPNGSMIVSSSQSPKRLPSASAGRSCMLVRLAMLVALVGGKALTLFRYLSSWGICFKRRPVGSACTWL